MKAILAAVDGSPDSLVALRHGAELALRSGAALRALFVKDVKLVESSALAQEVSKERLQEALAREAEGALGRARDVAGRSGLRIAVDARQGVVPTVLVEESSGADLLTMGRWGEHPLWSGGLLGSAVEAVVRKVRLPVLVASGAYERTRRIVVAHDGSEIAERAHRFAHQVGRLLEVTPNVRRVEEGDPAREIAAESTPEALVFLGAYGKSPLRALVIGSVTEQVMRRAQGPVVLCR